MSLHSSLKARGERSAAQKAEARGQHDKRADEKMIRRAMSEHDSQQHSGKHTKLKFADGGSIPGGKSKSRGDRKGKSGAKTHVNVIVAGGGDKSPAPMPVPVPMAGPPHPPVAPPAPPPMPPGGGAPGMAGGPPGLPVGAGRPPMMPPRAAGGRFAKGGAVHVIDDGAGSGPGRLEKEAAYGAKSNTKEPGVKGSGTSA